MLRPGIISRYHLKQKFPACRPAFNFGVERRCLLKRHDVRYVGTQETFSVSLKNRLYPHLHLLRRFEIIKAIATTEP
jgi:hypothetical protein